MTDLDSIRARYYESSKQTEPATLECPYCCNSDNIDVEHFSACSYDVGVKHFSARPYDYECYFCRNCGKTFIQTYETQNYYEN